MRNSRYSGRGLNYPDDIFDRVERNQKKIFGGFLVLWILGFVASLAIIGVGIWAIITLVNHFAGT